MCVTKPWFSKRARKWMLSSILFTGDGLGSIFPVWDLRFWESSNTRFAGWRWKSEMLGPLFFSPNFVFYKGQHEPKGLGGKGCCGEGGRPHSRSGFAVNLQSWCFLYSRLQEAETCQLGCRIPEETAASRLRNKGNWGAEGEQEASAATLSLCCNSSWSEPASLPFRVPWGN